MIEKKDIMPLNYFAKEPFSGSDRGMRYRIEAIKEEKKNVGLLVTVWPQPFSFECTADEYKKTFQTEFDEEGRDKVLEWLNDAYESDKAVYEEASRKLGI